MQRTSSVIDRFWQKVNITDNCWEWTAAPDKDGYGRINAPGSPSFKIKAHRMSWLIHFGPFDQRLMVLHRCDNPKCVRPDHLFLGDAATNARDMSSKRRGRDQAKDACLRGHAFTSKNTWTKRGTNQRHCRACDALRHRVRRGVA